MSQDFAHILGEWGENAFTTPYTNIYREMALFEPQMLNSHIFPQIQRFLWHLALLFSALSIKSLLMFWLFSLIHEGYFIMLHKLIYITYIPF